MLVEFKKETGISEHPVYRLFPGKWAEVLAEAGLTPHPAHKKKTPDEELFQEYFRVTDDLGRLPSYNEFARRSGPSIGVYEHRFGNFTEFRKHAIKYGDERGLIEPEIAKPSLDELQDQSAPAEPAHERIQGRLVLGETIGLASMLHAPVREQEVVYLFGILAEKMGYAVYSIRPDQSPDCEAKRRIKSGGWQNIRIEFEVRSSNFLRHHHDVTQCDIIVCWEHDWRNCPLEVVSLKHYVEKHMEG